MAKEIQVRLSSKARKALGERTAPLVIELELYFSCLIRKRVLFPVEAQAQAIPMSTTVDNVRVYFRPVMTRACGVDDVREQGAPELEDFPIVRAEAFSPRWLALDFRDGAWKGEYGYVQAR